MKIIHSPGAPQPHEHSPHYDYLECLKDDCVCNTEGMGVYEETWCECGLLEEQHA